MNKWDIFNQAQARSETCQNCPYGVKIKDPYSTGDYWFTVTECTANVPDECPDVFEYELSMEELNR